MVEINLLPWRNQLSLYERKHLNKLIMAALLAAVMVVAAAHWLLARQIRDLQTRKTELGLELDQYQAQQKLLAATRPLAGDAAQRQTGHDSQTGKLFVELGKSRPSSVCFTEIARSQNSTLFTGQARSAAELADYLLHWDAAALFSELQIEELQRQSAHGMKFRFRGVSGGINGERQDDAI